MNSIKVPEGFYEWADETFGGTLSEMKQQNLHAAREIEEALECGQPYDTGPGDEFPLELADIAMIYLHGLHIIQKVCKEQGIDLETAILLKMGICQNRKWERDAEGVVTHVRTSN